MILFVFWNARSAESLEALPLLNQFYKKTDHKKCRILGIVKEPVHKAAKYIKKKAIRFCNFYDMDEMAREEYEIDAEEEPVFWLVDDAGNVRLRLAGYNAANLHKIKRFIIQSCED